MPLGLPLAVAVLLVLLLPAPTACDRVRGDILHVLFIVEKCCGRGWLGRVLKKAKRGGES